MAMRIIFAAALALLALAGAAQAQDKLEQTKLKLGVGGKSLLYYLPLTVAERQGYFKDEGLQVEIEDFQGGAKSLQALMGGSVDVVSGAYDHTIQIQAKGQQLTAVVAQGRYPGVVIGLRPDVAAKYKEPKDLKGLKFGVTAPGSTSHFAINKFITSHGMKLDDVSVVGVGVGASAVAALQRGDIDGLSNFDPAITQLEQLNLIKPIVDTRVEKGMQDLYGGPYPAAVLYLQSTYVEKNPKTVQALVNAMLRALDFVHKSTPDEIAKVMPPEYALGDPTLYRNAIEHSKTSYSVDGKIDPAGAENAAKVLASFDEAVAKAKIDVTKTYTAKFVDAAAAAKKAK
ncbi:ABC transporter substrate-binding protein [Roseiterribacter gracilis]|uniref:ABC transporter substrate-binding protein n=1 Tax=Roseiterribacter gracilis TaxID=2812848 RepID=A0A8S8X916_9PROT|nr:ABC transporter substrate-binding protein [Rhodospirillales bacterium TMPK1]